MKKQSARIRELFYAAVEQNPDQWSHFLEVQCQGDRQLINDVTALLTAHGQAQEFLRDSFYEGMNIELVEEPKSVLRPSHLRRGQRIGAYTLLTKIGEGGMAVVYLAEQENPKREVALKFVKAGVHSTEQQQRFQYEARVLGRLRHPGIAHIYEFGSAETDLGEQPFFAMEYIPGPSLTEYAKREDLEMSDRLRLLAKVADAVHYAHQKGVIHRDLKPANIVVDETGQPKILDFGIARAVEGDDVDGGPHTSTGQLVGTLAYMSPERCAGDSAAIDVRTDVYALGVVGYELLSGRMPYDWENTPIVKQIRTILEEDPPFLGFINADCRGEVETIVAKAMSKERPRRYQSAAAFADDLKRYLAGDPIEAKSDSKYYLLWKTVRKYRVPTAVVTAFLVMLSLSTVFITSLWFQASGQRSNAREATALTHSILSQVIQEFEDAVRPLAGGKQVSERILAQVALDLEKLRPLVESDAALEDVLMALREKQGDIAYTQGRHAEAAEHYQVFLQISQRLAENTSENQENNHYLSVARAHRKLALVTRNAVDHFQKAIAHCERELRRDSNSLEAKYESSQTHANFARRLFDTGQYEQAVPQIEAAIAILEPVVRLTEDNYRWEKLQMRAYGFKGRNLLELGEKELSLESLNKSLELGESLVREHPADTELRYSLMQTSVKLGIIHYQAQHLEKARRILEKAIGIGQYLTKADPSITAWQNQLRAAHHELARVYRRSKEWAKAHKHSDVAAELAQSLVQVEAENPAWQRGLASSKLLDGSLLVLEMEWQEAFDAFEEAKVIYESLLTVDSENVALKSKLAHAFDWLGKCSRNLDQSEAAFDYYTQAYEIRRALHNAQPDVAQHILDLVLSKTKLATWHYSQKTPEGDRAALRLLKKAKAFLLEHRKLEKLAGHERRFKDSLKHIDQELIKIQKNTDEARSAES